MSDDTKLKRMSIRELVSGVRTSSPSANPNVTQLRSWDSMEQAITKANNYLVQAQVEEERCRRAHEEAVARIAEAQDILAQAHKLFVERARTVLGVDPLKECKCGQGSEDLSG